MSIVQGFFSAYQIVAQIAAQSVIKFLSGFEGVNGATTLPVDIGPALTVGGTASTVSLSSSVVKFGATSAKFASGGFAYTAVNSLFDVTTSDFTVEMWVYPVSSGYLLTFSNGAVYGASVALHWNGTNIEAYLASTGASNAVSIISNVAAAANTWTHVALTRANGAVTFWVNGQSAGTGTYSGPGKTGCRLMLNGINDNNGFGNSTSSCYLDDVRYILGFALYTAPFTPPTVSFTSTIADPYFSNVVLLAHMEGVNGDTSFTEQLGNVFTVNTGSPTLSTTVAKFGTASLAHPSGSYVSTPANTSFDITTGAFTVELFVYLTAYNSVSNNVIGLLGNCAATNGSGWFLGLSSGATSIIFQTIAAGSFKDNITSTAFTQLALNAWHHIAVSFDGTTYSFYADDVRANTAASSGSVPAGGAFAIGAYTQNLGFPGNSWIGNIDEVRVTKGTGRYSGATITIPSAAF